jgi:hypothetical protein
MRLLAMRGNRAAEAVSIRGNSQRHGLTTAIVRALVRTGLTDKEIAAALQVNAAQFYRQREGQDGHYLHVQRFDLLPEELHALFLDALIEELARLRGKTVVSPAGHLAAMSTALRALGDVVEQLSVQSVPASLPLFDVKKRA